MNKFVSIFLSLAILMLMFCGCKPVAKRTFFAMDTVITVETDNEEVIDKIVQKVSEIEKAVSFHNQDSNLSKLNFNRSVRNDPILYEIIKTSIEYSKKTDGAFNICLGQITSLYNFEEQKAPTKEYTASLLDTIHPDNVMVLQSEIKVMGGALVDLGGVAKGYTLDEAIKILKQENVKSAYLNFGGSIYYLSDTEKSVGIRKPFTENEIAAELLIKNKVVTTAGNYERYFKKDDTLYHHILDGKTGLPVNNGVNSVTVISDSATVGDIFSTALFVMGADEGIKYANQNNILAVFILSDGSIKMSSGLKYNNQQKIVVK